MACLADTKTFAIADMRGGLSLNGARVTAMDSQSSARVVSARLSPDGTRLLTVDTDGLVSLTSVPDGRRISNFSKSVDVIHRLGISPKGTHVVMITKNGTGIVRETASAHEKRIFAGDVSSLSFSAHGEYLAFGGWGAVRPILWEFATGQSHRLEGLGHSTGIQAVTFSADSRLLATGGKDNTIILWDCRSDRQITRLSGHMAAVTALAFSPGGTILASGDSESTVRLWDLPSERELTILRGHSGGVAQLDFSADETILASIGLASGGYRYNAIVWSAVPIK
jgi:WD40 repeat protein